MFSAFAEPGATTAKPTTRSADPAAHAIPLTIPPAREDRRDSRRLKVPLQSNISMHLPIVADAGVVQVNFPDCAGTTTSQAAAQLFMGTRTVEAHLSRIYRKLGVTSRTEMAHVLHTLATQKS